METLIWNAVPAITSGLTLLSFITAVGAWVYRLKLSHDRELIESAPKSRREAVISAYLGRFDVDTANLTKQQQYDVVVRQIDGQARRFKWVVASSLVIALLFTIMAFFAFDRVWDNDTLRSELSELEEIQNELELSQIETSIFTADAVTQAVQVAEAAPSSKLNPELLERSRQLLARIERQHTHGSLNPKLRFRFQLAKARLAASEGRFEESLRISRELSIDDSADMLSNGAMPQVLRVQADSMYGLGKWREALTDYQTIQKTVAGVDDDVIHSRIGVCFARLRRFDQALEVFTGLIHDYESRIADGETDLELNLARTLSDRAACREDEGDFPPAITDLARAIPLFENFTGTSARVAHANALNNRGLLRIHVGQLDSALADLEHAIAIYSQLDPEVSRRGYAEALNNAGIAHIRLGERTGELELFQKSIDSLNKSVALIEELPSRNEIVQQQWKSEVLLNRALARLKLGKIEQSEADFDIAIQTLVGLIDRGAHESELLLAKALYGHSLLPQKADDALADLNQAIITLERLKGNQPSTDTLETLARSYARRGLVQKQRSQHDDAVSDCRRAIELFDQLDTTVRDDLKAVRAGTMATRGESHLLSNQHENFAKARNDFDAAIEIMRELVQSGRKSMRQNLAISLMNRGAVLEGHWGLDDAKEMEELLDESVRIWRELALAGNERFRGMLAAALKGRGIWRRRAGNVSKAIKDYGEAIDILKELPNPSDLDDVNLTQTYHNRAWAYRETEQFEQAIEDYSNAIKRREEHGPGNQYVQWSIELADNLNWRGRSYWSINNVESAIKDLDRSIKILVPIVEHYPQWNDRLATSLAFRADCYRRQNKMRLSLNDWKMAIERLESGDGQHTNWLVNELVDLSWLLATHPDPQIRDGFEAEMFALRACKLTDRKEMEPLKCLAAAFGAQGNHQSATAVLEEAIKVASPEDASGLQSYLTMLRVGESIIDDSLALDSDRRTEN